MSQPQRHRRAYLLALVFGGLVFVAPLFTPPLLPVSAEQARSIAAERLGDYCGRHGGKPGDFGPPIVTSRQTPRGPLWRFDFPSRRGKPAYAVRVFVGASGQSGYDINIARSTPPQ